MRPRWTRANARQARIADASTVDARERPSGADRRCVHLDLHRLADEQAALGERLLPRQAEVGPVDLTAPRDADALVPPRVLAGALDRRVERDLARDVLDREVPRHPPVGAAERLQAGGLEA